jgi:hypothetical protein
MLNPAAMQSVTDTATLTELWRNVAPLAFMACCGFAYKVSSRLVKVETLLKVAVGDSGTNGEMGKLREGAKQLSSALDALDKSQALVAQRVDALEGR